MKKFEFTGETMTTFFGKTLHRIRAIADIINSFGDVIVKAGQLGGWLEKEENLSQDGNAWVCDDARVYDDAWVCDDAVVKKPDQYLTVGPIGSRNDTTTFFRNAKGVIKVKCGCFIGTIDAFLEKVTSTHGDNKHAVAYRAAAALALVQVDTTVTDDEPPKEIDMNKNLDNITKEEQGDGQQ